MRQFSRLTVSDMPEERDIEKQLRAASEQRRKDAGGKFELHPAPRRLLQGEVGRVHGQKSSAPSRSFWPRFAWGVSMVAILTVGVWVLVRPQKKSKETAPAPTEIAGYVQNAVAPTDGLRAPAENRADSSVARVPSESAPATVVPGATPPAAAAGKIQVGDVDREKKVAAKDLAETKSRATGVELPAMVAASGAVAGGAQLAQEQPANYNFRNASAERQMFANAPAKKAGAKISAAQANLLNSFQLEQSGNRIRIVDNDGSVYEGALLADAREEAAPRKALKSVTLAGSLKTGTEKAGAQTPNQNFVAQQNFRFAAAGTNLSLRQRVTINGAFVAATGAAENSVLNLDKISNQQLKAKVQSGVWLSNGRVTGRAVTADGQAVELDAEQVQMK